MEIHNLIIRCSDEITLKLNAEASHLSASTELYVHKSMRSFLEASQLFIGLIYVHEQQVRFLYGKLLILS